MPARHLHKWLDRHLIKYYPWLNYPSYLDKEIETTTIEAPTTTITTNATMNYTTGDALKTINSDVITTTTTEALNMHDGYNIGPCK